MATIQVRVDDITKKTADSLFNSLGLDTSTAVRMFISAAINDRGFPFDVRKKAGPIEINDGHGSYVCEYGHLHDYSKMACKLDKCKKDISGHFNSIEDLMASLNED